MDDAGSLRSMVRGDTRGDRAVGKTGRSSPTFDTGRDSAGCGAASQPRLHWHDVEDAAARLTPADHMTLKMLIRVPFADITLLTQLDGLHSGAAIYRRIARLRSGGLVDELRPTIELGHGPGLVYVTDLGLAAIAIAQRADPRAVARSFRVSGGDLQRRLL